MTLILQWYESLHQTRYGTYTLAGGGDSASVDVFDYQGQEYTQQLTAKGYDTMTGIGSPNGRAFVEGLRWFASNRKPAVRKTR